MWIVWSIPFTLWRVRQWLIESGFPITLPGAGREFTPFGNFM